MIQSIWWARMVVTLVHVDWRVLAAIRATVIIALAAALVYFLRQSPAPDRHRLWALSLGLCLCLPAVSALVAGEADAAALAVPHWLFAVWLVGAAALLLRALIGVTIATRVSRSAKPVEDHEWGSLMADVRGAMGVSRRVALRTTRDVAAPITLGWLRPVVLIPPEHVTWSDECRHAVLAHEIAHVRRHDWPLQLLERLVCALYWFLPPVHWAAGRRRVEAERACDEMVVARGVPRAAYARHLLAVAEASSRPLGSALAFTPGVGDLDERVRAILGRPPAMRGRWSIAAGGIVAAGVATIVVTAPGPVCPIAMEVAQAATAVNGTALPSSTVASR